MKAIVWDGDEKGAKYHERDISGAARRGRGVAHKLLDTVCGEDDEVLEKYLADEPISEADLKHVIRLGTLAGHFVPVLTGSAFKNKGVQPMLDAVIDFLPSPLDIPPTEGTNLRGDEVVTREADEKAPFAALAFKIVSDPFGKLTYFRVYSGQIDKGDEVYNSTKEKRERIGRILLMHANQREDLDAAMAGDIVAGLGFKETTTGDTLCDRSDPIILERMEFPEPVIHVAIEPKTKSDQDKLGKALKSLSEEDPTFRVRSDEETGQTVISGMGELHLEILVDRMQREFTSRRRSASRRWPTARRSPRRSTSVEYRHIKQTGGSGQFAVVKISVEPNPGKGYEFVDKISGGRIPREYIQPTNQGIQAALENGVLAGYPTGRRQGAPRRRPVPRRRLVGDGVQDRRSDGVPQGRRRLPSRCCSSRSWRSRSSPPRSTWAT